MFKILKRTSSLERLYVVLSVVFILFQVFLDLKIPDYMSTITMKLQDPNTSVSDILGPGFEMIGLSLLSFASAIIVGYFAARIAAGLATRVRGELFNKVSDFSAAEVQNFSVPSLVTRTTNDLTQIQMLIAMGLQVVIKGPITAIWALTKISNKSFEWTLATAVAVGVLLIMISTIMFFVRPKFAIIQKLTDDLNGVTREGLTGLRVIRAYNASDYQEEKFEARNNHLTEVNLFTGRMMAMFNPVMTLISSGLTLSVYWIGAFLIQNAEGMDRITLFSDMVVFMSYAMQVVMGFMMMTMIFFILPRSMVSARRINEVLDLDNSILFTEPSQADYKPVGDGRLSFKNVSFSYPNASDHAVEGIDFSIETGQTLAFIGSTGSGKSTVLKLIPRLYDINSGSIELNGKDLKSYSREQLNDIIGYIPQKPVLFEGTIRSNINFGHSYHTPLDDNGIYDALRIAQAETFVKEEPGELDAPVSQGGSNFSGGQKQRLAIARVIARRPEIMMFDDSFSALDYRTDRTLREVLKKELPNTTKVIVAQRISTIMDADLIVVLEEGKIVGKGTHQSLLESNTVYQEIAYSQLSKEELENEK